MSFHFISGLPRSGSSLLSALLNQNPRFKAGVSSPVYSLWISVIPKMSGSSEFASFFDDERRASILKGMMENFYRYDDGGERRVIFDTNRSWTGKMSLISAVYPAAKVICCVRDIGSILNSVELMLRKNPLQTSRTFGFKVTPNVYAREEVLMNSQSGLIGSAWTTMREAWFGELSESMIVIQYERLTSDPEGVMRGLYSALGQPFFKHDFGNIEFDAERYDADLGMPGLHSVEKGVRSKPRDVVLPPDLIEKHRVASFWLDKKYMNKALTL